MMRISEEQFARFEKIAHEQYLQRLRVHLGEYYDWIDKDTADTIFNSCVKNCEKYGILSEYAIHAYCSASFYGDEDIGELKYYKQAHPIFLKEFGTPERLPVEICERLIEAHEE